VKTTATLIFKTAVKAAWPMDVICNLTFDSN
jgi:hypothetical protein